MERSVDPFHVYASEGGAWRGVLNHSMYTHLREVHGEEC